jgi:hypothetical protein
VAQSFKQEPVSDIDQDNGIWSHTNLDGFAFGHLPYFVAPELFTWQKERERAASKHRK